MSNWQPGNRVVVILPDHHGVAGKRGVNIPVSGTVREIDPPGLPRGVRVDLDFMVNGVQDCFASHGELRAVPVE